MWGTSITKPVALRYGWLKIKWVTIGYILELILTKTRPASVTGNDMRKQLELTKEELEAIGFIEQYVAADTIDGTPNEGRTWYTMPVTNAEFIYNVNHAPYKWHFRTMIGDGYNSNWLDIAKLPELYIVLSSFQANFIMAVM